LFDQRNWRYMCSIEHAVAAAFAGRISRARPQFGRSRFLIASAMTVARENTQAFHSCR
jgi:hypothetical protein